MRDTVIRDGLGGLGGERSGGRRRENVSTAQFACIDLSRCQRLVGNKDYRFPPPLIIEHRLLSLQ